MKQTQSPLVFFTVVVAHSITAHISAAGPPTSVQLLGGASFLPGVLETGGADLPPTHGHCVWPLGLRGAKPLAGEV